ncbi:MAG: TlpA family protein disulfide reductase [Opitutaceae bacterium]|nr:TlpA family protein disulfide reductase [Opitutaceae bacterium]
MRAGLKLRLGCIACGCGLLTPAPGQVEKIRGVVETSLLPLPAAAAPDREAEWAEIQTLITAIPPLSVSSPLPGLAPPDYRGYPAWQESSNRVLRDLGVQFFQRYPDDPRCWVWLEATLRRHPRYLRLSTLWRAGEPGASPPEIDEAAVARWRELYPGIRSTGAADPRAPLELRVKLRIQEVNAPDQRFIEAAARQVPVDFAATVDWDAWAGRLADLGREFPAAPDDLVTAAAHTFFRRARRYAPESVRVAQRLLADSPHAALRALAAAHLALDEARRTPLEMRFTAVDGREVDLRRLRGKVVLIDFWAATWCSACKVQKPLLKAVYDRYQAQGFEVIGIACEMKPEDRSRLLDTLAQDQITWPQFFDGRGMKNRFASQFGFLAIPQYLLLDRRGLLVVHTEGSGGLRNLEEVVRRELGLAPLRAGDELRELGGKTE